MKTAFENAHAARAWMRRAVALAACGLALPLAIAGCAPDTGASLGGSSADDSAGSSVDVSDQALSAAYDLECTDRDKDASYDASDAILIELSGASASVVGAGASVSGSAVTIASEGTYVVKGSLSNGQLVVDAADTDKVQIVLAGAEIENASGPALYVKQADKCFVTLAAQTENALVDGADYVLEEGADEPSAALFSKADLTINGAGSLRVQGNYRHAIASKDDLVITGGVFDVSAVEDAIHGRDCVKIFDGSFALSAGEDAVEASNADEAGRGFVSIEAGTFSVNAADDAFHAETLMRIAGGTIDVAACAEGLEGAVVFVSGGTVHIVSTDDGINASSSATDSDPASADAGQGGRAPGAVGGASCAVAIAGGYTVIDAGGDGIDSNGTFSMTDGVLLVMGPTSADNSFFDYDVSATISGGTCLMAGGAGMAQGFSAASQPFVMASVSGQAGQTVSLADETGAVVVSFTASRAFDMVVASGPSLAEGEACSLIVGDAPAGANEDGFAGSGSAVGAVAAEVVASCEASAPGAGGPGAGGPGAPGARGVPEEGGAGPKGAGADGLDAGGAGGAPRQ